MNSSKIIVIGSCNTDMVIKTDRLPRPGETVLGGEFMMNPGGKGANQAVAAARLGGDVVFVCKVGVDLFGDNAIEGYKSEKIDTSYISRAEGAKSGVALISVDKRGENSIVVASGANNLLSVDDVSAVAPIMDASSVIVMQLESPLATVEYAARIAHQKGAMVLLNPAPAPSAPLSDAVLECVDLIIPNATEASILSGVEVVDWASAEQAANVIASKGVSTVIITLGSRGALVKEHNECYQVPAIKVEAVDTTAAGDTFCGALAVALTEQMSMRDAVLFATKASSIAVTRMGAQASAPYRNELF